MWGWQSWFGTFVPLSNDKTKTKKQSAATYLNSCIVPTGSLLSTSSHDLCMWECESRQTNWIIKVNYAARRQKKIFSNVNKPKTNLIHDSIWVNSPKMYSQRRISYLVFHPRTKQNFFHKWWPTCSLKILFLSNHLSMVIWAGYCK